MMMNSENPKLEHYGNLCCSCKNGKAQVVTTGPLWGEIKKTAAHVLPVSYPDDKRIECPKGTQLVGYYHTHVNGVNFSPTDLETLEDRDHPYYMSQDGVHVKKAIPMRTRDPKVIRLYIGGEVKAECPVPPRVFDLK